MHESSLRRRSDSTISDLATFRRWGQETFPLPGDFSTTKAPLVFAFEVDLKGERSALWQRIVDTSRFNRALGQGVMKLEERHGRLHGSTRVGGLLHEWSEPPWEWVANQYLVCDRIYTRGYPKFLRVLYRMEEGAKPGHVRLFISFTWIPRNGLFAFGIRAGMPQLIAGYRSVLSDISRSLQSSQTSPYLIRPAPLPPSRRDRLNDLASGLVRDGSAPELVRALTETIAQADDFDADRLQAKVLARNWKRDLPSVLRLLLQATRKGMLTLSWDIICPHCRGVRLEADHLSAVPARGQCDVCQIDFDTAGENSIEITFHIHPSIREVPNIAYCSADVSTKRHIFLHVFVDPQEERAVSLRLPEGLYGMRLKGEKNVRRVRVGQSARTDQSDQWTWSSKAPLGELPQTEIKSETRVVLQNPMDESRIFILETLSWMADSLRPSDVFSFPEFRDLFSEESLATDVKIFVGEQTVLFTDIVGSTRFYQEAGDPKAFAEVRRHFRELLPLLAKHEGVLVKTIGDAIMAAFANPTMALSCAKAIHETFSPQRTDTPIRLRLSINTGPCLAVKMDSNIDYFGGTVNLAAKLQAGAEAGEIAIGSATLDSPGVAEFLTTNAYSIERRKMPSKSYDDGIEFGFWKIYEEAGSTS